MAKPQLERRIEQQESELQELCRLLSALRIFGKGHDPKSEIIRYLDGFLGPMEWMMTNSLNTVGHHLRPAHSYDLVIFQVKMKKYVEKWRNSILPRHRRSTTRPLTKRTMEVFDEYINLRDETLFFWIIQERDSRDVVIFQQWNLLMEQIGVDLGYPGLTQRHSVNGDPETWKLALQTMRESARRIETVEMSPGDFQADVIGQNLANWIGSCPEDLGRFMMFLRQLAGFVRQYCIIQQQL